MSIALSIGGLVAAVLTGRLLWARHNVAQQSVFLLGRTREEERALSAQLGIDVVEFMVQAQRIMWGLEQPDLIRVDVDAACQQLAAAFPRFFATYLLHAYAARYRGQTTAADAALLRARELLPADHPFAHIMPTESEWKCQPPEVRLEELVPGAIWRVPGYFTQGSTSPFLKFMYATLVRLSDGRLVLFNPVPLPAAVLQEIRALGEVSHIVVPLKFHNRFIAQTCATFPAAKCIGVPGHQVNPPSAKLHFDGFLKPGETLFPEDLDQVELGGHQFEETAFYHRASKTAILHDMLYGCLPDVPGSTFWARLYAMAWGVPDTVGLPAYHPMMISNLLAMQRALPKMLRWDSERVVSAHVPTHAVARDGQAVLQRVFGWGARIRVPEFLMLVGTYFWRQPRFMRDLVIYMIKQRQ